MMKQKMRSTMVLCIISVMIFCNTCAVYADVPYKSYTYTFSKGYPDVAYSPTPFIPSKVIDTKTLGIGLKQPVDMCRDKDGNIYILDAGTNCIIITDRNWKVTYVINSFINHTEKVLDEFDKPEGLFVADNGYIYIADTQNHRVVVLKNNGDYVMTFTTPVSDVFPKEYQFLPRKIAVDKNKRIYVISRNDFSGILEFNPDGKFFGYMGSNRVTFNPIDMFWKKIMTKQQKSQLVQFIPVEYTNMSLDQAGFLYTVSAADTEPTPVKRLNPSGQDVLIRAGYEKSVSGDLWDRSKLVDICSDENGIYSILDFKRGRIFSYNSDGYLLYAFGGMGSQRGTFKSPVSIDASGEQLAVVDELKANITVFEMTDYAKLIKKADSLYNSGKYEESLNTWKEVIKLNANFELAYAQIGRVLLRQEKYKEAMEYFKLGNMRGGSVVQDSGYNKAFGEYRKIFLRNHLGQILSVVFILLIAFILYKVARGRKPARTLRRSRKEDSL